MISHEAALELLGAYALDAVDGAELLEIQEHLAVCPRCRAELDSLRDVAAALGNSVEPLPDGLWSGIASQLPERPDEERPPPMPIVVSERPHPSERTRRRRGRAPVAVATLVALTMAAAAVAIVLGIGLVRADNQVSRLQATVYADHHRTALAFAFNTPGHEVVHLDSSRKVEVVQFVILPDGRGYLVTSRLPALPVNRTYQLWGIVNGTPISLGLLGPVPKRASFTMAGSTMASRLSITAEPSGGTVSPTGSIVATGPV